MDNSDQTKNETKEQLAATSNSYHLIFVELPEQGFSEQA